MPLYLCYLLRNYSMYCLELFISEIENDNSKSCSGLNIFQSVPKIQNHVLLKLKCQLTSFQDQAEIVGCTLPLATWAEGDNTSVVCLLCPSLQQKSIALSLCSNSMNGIVWLWNVDTDQNR